MMKTVESSLSDAKAQSHLEPLCVRSVVNSLGARALGQTAIAAYLLDVAPEEYRGSFIAVYNLVIGMVTFFGSLIGGYLSDYMTALYGLIAGMQIVYLISTVGRAAGAVLHVTLRETLRR